jgi:hypothetical protein
MRLNLGGMGTPKAARANKMKAAMRRISEMDMITFRNGIARLDCLEGLR